MLREGGEEREVGFGETVRGEKGKEKKGYEEQKPFYLFWQS